MGEATSAASHPPLRHYRHLDGDHSYPPDAISYLIEAFLHLEVDFLNASRFPFVTAKP